MDYNEDSHDVDKLQTEEEELLYDFLTETGYSDEAALEAVSDYRVGEEQVLPKEFLHRYLEETEYDTVREEPLDFEALNRVREHMGLE